MRSITDSFDSLHFPGNYGVYDAVNSLCDQFVGQKLSKWGGIGKTREETQILMGNYREQEYLSGLFVKKRYKKKNGKKCVYCESC